MIPQSMAYAKLAGLPLYYGLYASFLPPIIAVMFGSSFHLATGPVAVVSLMTSSALEPLATAGSVEYISYALVLALIVGIFQFLLGLLKLGIIVNFLSHPVIQGFTFAAAFIIASSQISKMFGIHVDKAETHYMTLWLVFKSGMHYVHWPTFAMTLFAFSIMVGLKKFKPRAPNVLIAVVITTITSWLVGYEKIEEVRVENIHSPKVQDQIKKYNLLFQDTIKVSNKIDVALSYKEAGRSDYRSCHYCHVPHPNQQPFVIKKPKIIKDKQIVSFFHHKDAMLSHVNHQKLAIKKYRALLRHTLLFKGVDEEGKVIFREKNEAPPGFSQDGLTWRIKLGKKPLNERKILLSGGGDVVGSVPKGLPSLSIPHFDLSLWLSLIPVAIIIALLGFMESISISYAISARSGQYVDSNQELIGQGLGNIVSSLTQGYPVSGSFSRSAVNLKAGGVTGMSSVFSGLYVAAALLFFTPILYHLPEAVLVAIIMMAVLGLVHLNELVHAFRVQKYDGVIGAITFIATLVSAPHLDRGILLGLILTLLSYLIRSTKSKVSFISRVDDDFFGCTKKYQLKECPYLMILKLHGSLIFANSKNIQAKILYEANRRKNLKHIILLAGAINEIDASGEIVLTSIIQRLKSMNIKITLVGMSEEVKETLRRTEVYKEIGEESLINTINQAVHIVHPPLHQEHDGVDCPL